MDLFKLTNAVTPETTSFFPTSNEISGGVRWIREHPLMAAATCAAATAFTMAAYLASQVKEPARLLQVTTSTDLYESKRVNQVTSPSDKATEKDSTFDFSDYSEICQQRRRNTVDDDMTDCPRSPGYMSLSPLEHDADRAEENEGIGSPEWGWYVSTTPPEDFYPQSNYIARRD
ncbi:hypothetical protein THRCLA_08771 [Thraustotheca clavata]|uniref:Uncharacterized protein n=1 Tax=Thraustotheca clavata TaxID=74557 RepID=A0A1V9Z2F4_9STRA|nr:hypothetical protein THRCLA_08771 [Thraustotheca clavata]